MNLIFLMDQKRLQAWMRKHVEHLPSLMILLIRIQSCASRCGRSKVREPQHQKVTSECADGFGHIQRDKSGRLPLSPPFCLWPPKPHTKHLGDRWCPPFCLRSTHRTTQKAGGVVLLCDVFEHSGGDYRVGWRNTWSAEKVCFIMVPWGASRSDKYIKVLLWSLLGSQD